MDLKVLFHTPEDLSEKELHELRQKLNVQHTLPYCTALLTGFGLYFFEGAVLRKTTCYRRTAAAAALGFAIGAWGSYQVSTTITRVNQQSDIV